MLPIMVEQQPSQKCLDRLGVSSWPVWSCEVSEFSWHYEQREVCYLLEGEVVVTGDEGASVDIAAGDLVSFPAGLACKWTVLKPVRKQYRLG
jgi:uncharacterized cupin superfamily protein